MGKFTTLTIHIDGAARGNPGPAAYGFIIYHDGKPILEEKGRLGVATNNVAEYTALIKALQKAAALGASTVLIRSDSELLIKQMNGQYRVRNENLRPLYEEARALREEFDSVTFTHVLREQNREADRLCNEALDEPAPEKNSPAPARRVRKSKAAAADPAILDESWHAAWAAAERVLREAAHAWAADGPELLAPADVLDQIIGILQKRGFVTRPDRGPEEPA
jgi:ribonuclease HI